MCAFMPVSQTGLGPWGHGMKHCRFHDLVDGSVAPLFSMGWLSAKYHKQVRLASLSLPQVLSPHSSVVAGVCQSVRSSIIRITLNVFR